MNAGQVSIWLHAGTGTGTGRGGRTCVLRCASGGDPGGWYPARPWCPCREPRAPLSARPAHAGAEAGRAALLLYKRSAAQGNHGALLRIGDSYWYGKGVARDWRRAAQVGSSTPGRAPYASRLSPNRFRPNCRAMAWTAFGGAHEKGAVACCACWAAIWPSSGGPSVCRRAHGTPSPAQTRFAFRLVHPTPPDPPPPALGADVPRGGAARLCPGPVQPGLHAPVWRGAGPRLAPGQALL